jgi:valyl-tRNA synthetase
METAYDIIFFWVARMMMLGLELTDREPFAYVYLSGLVRDPLGRKFSKTKGIAIDPLDAIDQYGADALRFALVEGVAPGADTRLGPDKLEGARNFGNKLWNATRFVLGARPGEIAVDAPLALPDSAHVGPAERWILDRCAATTASVTRAFEILHVGEAARLLHEAIWAEYCDWYIELAKARLRSSASAEERAATWQTLTWVLDRYLRLLHPLMPFITETIWGRMPHRPDDPELLIVAPWPQVETTSVPAGDGAALEPVFELVREIRNARSEAGVEAGAWLDVSVWLADAEARTAIAELAGALGPLARSHLHVVGDPSALPGGDGEHLTIATGGGEARVSLPTADRERERDRLRKELGDAQRQLEAAEGRLGNADFVAKAPSAVVAGARNRAAELRDLVARLEARLQ